MSPLLGDERKILALPDAQEANSDPSNTGSPLEKLQALEDLQGRVDWTLVEAAPYWYRNVGKFGDRRGEVLQRARRFRQWCKARPEKEIIVVGHGMFWHFVTCNIDGTKGSGRDGEDDEADVWFEQQTGPYWQNLEWRTFEFEGEGEDVDVDAMLVETAASQKRRDEV